MGSEPSVILSDFQTIAEYEKMRAASRLPITSLLELRRDKGGGSKKGSSHWWESLNMTEPQECWGGKCLFCYFQSIQGWQIQWAPQEPSDNHGSIFRLRNGPCKLWSNIFTEWYIFDDVILKTRNEKWLGLLLSKYQCRPSCNKFDAKSLQHLGSKPGRISKIISLKFHWLDISV